MITIVLALLAAASNAGSSVLQRKANAAEAAREHTAVGGITDLLRQPVWLAGLGLVIVSFVFQAAALATGELAEVQPLMALELPITLVLASAVFHRRLRGRDWGAIVAMTLGMSLFLFCLSPTEGDPTRPGGLAWSLGAGGAGALVVVLVAAAYLGHRQRRAALLGAASGTSFALTAVFMSGALAHGVSWSLFAQWQTYLVAAAGIAAIVLLQEGMQAGTLVAVQPGVTLVDPVVAVVLGVLLFGEQVRTGGWVAGEVAAAVAVGFGAVALSRSPVAKEQGEAESGGAGQDDDGPSDRDDRDDRDEPDDRADDRADDQGAQPAPAGSA